MLVQVIAIRNSYTLSLFLLYFITFFPTGIFAAQCDEPAAQESVRIYFANGMGNTRKAALDSQVELKRVLGMTDRDFGLAYNDNENWLIQLMEVYQQRKNSSDDFWYWLRNMDEAPQWFHDEYVERVSRFNENHVQSDPDLSRQVQQYLADLNSGKKVVIVAHSQGNFYANNAYRQISINIPAYKDSIGIVSVATPATWVEGGGQYNINDVYTTDPNDLIMNLVRTFYWDTLPANVTAPANPTTKTSHEFISSYLVHHKDRIRNQILQRVVNLDVPEKEFDCKLPEEVPVDVNTTYASSISKTTARLNGYVVSGKQAAGHCIWRRADSGDPATCLALQNNIALSGTLDSGETFYCTATGLSPGTNYKFRVCGREGNRISDGGIQSFTTNPDTQQCGSSYNASGSSEGLNVDYNMGTTGAFANIEFTTYTIPDKLEIWHGGTLIYTTGNYISTGSNPLTKRICHEPSRGSTWNVKVYGNPDTGTAWTLKIACPQNTGVTNLCPTM